jgi:diadenylate cyclase
MTGFATFFHAPFTSVLISVLDAALVAYLIYRTALLIKGTRAQQVLIGLTWVALAYVCSKWLGLQMLYWILDHVIGGLFLVVVVVFQNDIRRGLSRVGKHYLWGTPSRMHTPNLITEITRTVEVLSKEHMGAILLIEREAHLGEWALTGVQTDAALSASVLISFFTPNTPLHDGAVIIQQGRIAAAAVFLPLAQNAPLDPRLGTRHRAAIGATEEVDALAIVVSEENGSIGYALDGTLTQDISVETLKNILETHIGPHTRRAASS